MKKDKKPLTNDEKKCRIQIAVIIIVTLLIMGGIALAGHVIEINYYR